MRLYRSTLTLASTSASQWQADTIFGHLCWSLVRREGEGFLTDRFLHEYREGNPLVLLSDGFPSGYLPRPRGGKGQKAGGQVAKDRRVREYRAEKDRLKDPLLSVDEFHRACRGEAVLPVRQPPSPLNVASKNQIDRLTDTAGGAGGQLYDFTEYRHGSIEVYWRIADGYESLVREFLEDLKRSGYGKRKSVGYGHVASFTLEPFDGFAAPPAANGFVTLSNFVPAAADPTDGFWTTTVKYGKLGEDLAADISPFKKPLIQLQAGACFYDVPIRDWYGRMVPDLAADRRVIQYGYAFPVPVCLPQRPDRTDEE